MSHTARHGGFGYQAPTKYFLFVGKVSYKNVTAVLGIGGALNTTTPQLNKNIASPQEKLAKHQGSGIFASARVFRRNRQN